MGFLLNQRDFLIIASAPNAEGITKAFSKTGNGIAGVSPAPEGFQWPFAGSLFPVPGFPVGFANTVVMLPPRGEM